MTEAPTSGAGIAQLLRKVSFTGSDEAKLQDALEELFTDEGLNFIREHKLSERDRIDFYFPELRLGVEVKTQGSLALVTRQLHRYALSDHLDSLVLCTTLTRHMRLPSTMLAKDVFIAWLGTL